MKIHHTYAKSSYSPEKPSVICLKEDSFCNSKATQIFSVEQEGNADKGEEDYYESFHFILHIFST